MTLITESLEEMEQYLIQLNKEQLGEGLDSEGRSLGQYTDATLAIKQQKGRPAKGYNITLFDTGDFYKSFLVSVIGNSLIMESKDWKESELISSFGQNIFGLTIDKKEEVSKRLYSILDPKIITTLKNA